MQQGELQKRDDLFDAGRDLAGLDAQDMLECAIRDRFVDRIAVVSSFGAESAVLLDLVARVDRGTPILFLETGKHFPETLEYRDLLVDRLGLTDVRVLRPDATEAAAEDPDGTLWGSQPDSCCALRKVRPLDRAIAGFDAWISGRKRIHEAERFTLDPVEIADGKLKLNPLATWTADRISDYFDNYGLPRHPLWEDGYLSIGCAPCTAKPKPGEGIRSGRWAGRSKTECGIHRPRSTASGAASVVPIRACT